MILLLDVMSTLVTEPFFEVIPKFFDMSIQDLLRDKHPSSWVEFEHGHCDENSYLDRFFADGRAFDHDGFRAMLRGCYEYIDGIEPLLAELKDNGVPMHALSNYPVWYEVIEDKLKLSRYIEWTFVSCNTGVRKPAPEAYTGPARTLGVDPSTCLFVDDRKSNCEAARAVGMPAIRFEDADSLRAALVTHGVL